MSNYYLYSNIPKDWVVHYDKLLTFLNIDDYYYDDNAKDVLGRKLEEHIALWLNEKYKSKDELIIQSSLYLSKSIRKKIEDKGIDVSNIDKMEFYYGNLRLKQIIKDVGMER